ncbi:MAG: potassium channel family protein [Blautia sp.]|nr:potassium channel family protein [Blautia sp.]MDY5031195.1 potassium channel family protein [Blautia sp.]
MSFGVAMKKIVYELSISIMAAASVMFAIMDILYGLPHILRILDFVIYIIFVFDYFIRFFLSKKKKSFFQNNIFDLIAIIPISSAMRVFRTFKIFRLLKLSKITKVTRFLAVVSRLFKKFQRFLNTNGLKYIIFSSGLLIVIGGALICLFEDISLIDGIWWSFVTATTVGYGDISPSSIPGRIIACILMITGIGVIGSLTSALTSFFISGNEHQVSSDRIDMVVKLYNHLNDSEKEEFKRIIR